MQSKLQTRAELSVNIVNDGFKTKWGLTGVVEFTKGDFYAKIAPPTVQFLCNEELILFITLVSFNLNASR
jgi:hypothetical protein